MLSKIASNLYLDRLLSPWFRGHGVALMFHRVLEENQRSRWTGLRGLEVSMAFYSEILDYFVKNRFKFLSAAELAESMLHGQCPSKFVVVTFDDGYKDNATYVAEEMVRRKLPWTLYVTSSFPDHTSRCWWYALGYLLVQNQTLNLQPLGRPAISLTGLGYDQRNQLYTELRELFHKNWTTTKMQEVIEKWFQDHGQDLAKISAQLSASWEDLTHLSRNGCDIGAHTVHHPNLLELEKSTVLQEMTEGSKRLQEKLKLPIKTFAYPFGDRSSAGAREVECAKEAGYLMAFTTRNGWIFPRHSQHLHTLPRINVSGSFNTFNDFKARLNGFATLRESGLRRVVTL